MGSPACIRPLMRNANPYQDEASPLLLYQAEEDLDAFTEFAYSALCAIGNLIKSQNAKHPTHLAYKGQN
ncbi:hypothetical protein V2J09_004277 [Rumex salicifolius]